ncbi:MAG: DUF2267 domain-containing protein [Thermoleophilaceae bacterium]
MSWDYEQFIRTIQHKADLSWDDANRVARIVLETLAERLSSGEARDIREQMPEEIRPWLETDSDAEGLSAAEFVRRVAERESEGQLDDVPPSVAERHVRAVLTALRRQLRERMKDREFRDVIAELGKDYAALVAPAIDKSPPADDLTLEQFLETVMNHSGLDREGAWRATQVVLETLGERLAEGEVRDIARQLPPQLREALARGNERSAGKAMRMSLDDFVERVEEREDLAEHAVAEEHVHAVFSALRETLDDKEFSDLRAELPKDFEAVLARR